jgi:hypothetical protein
VDTDERLGRIEARLEAVERVIEDAKAKFDVFARGPGRKMLTVLGVKSSAG